MSFASRLKLLIVSLVFIVPVIGFALAPVENVTQSQTPPEGQLADGQLVPMPDTPTPIASTSVDTASVQVPAPTNDTPLVGPSSNGVAVNTMSNPDTGSTTSSLPMTERVARLEQQMQNLVRINLPQQVADLQQQIQQLSGELQVQEHDIKLLNQQVRNFYQDLSVQIKQMKNLSTTTDVNTTNTSLGTNLSENTSSAALQASDAYKVALTQLTKKQYDEALKGFKSYIATYPNGRFVVNAHYWLGEIYVLKNSVPEAIQEFNTVISQYPKSEKVPDAQVKLGIIHASQGNKVLAKREFTDIKQKYPGTTAAQLASIQLQQVR